MLDVIEHDKKSVSMGEAGAVYTNMYANPLQTGQSSTFVCRVPNGSHKKTLLYVLRGTYTLAAATCTSCLAQLRGLTWAASATTVDQSFQITHGADAGDASATMTTAIEAFDSSTTALTLTPSSLVKARILGAGLRATGTGIDTESANLRGGNSRYSLRSGIGAFTGNGYIINSLQPEIFTIKQGITVRRNPPEIGSDAAELQSLDNYMYVQNIVHGEMPYIQITALSATTVVRFDWVYYVELEPMLETPIPVSMPDYEPELQAIDHMICNMPHVTEGHTFPSFLKGVWKGIATTGRYLWDRGLKRSVGNFTDAVIHKIDKQIASF